MPRKPVQGDPDDRRRPRLFRETPEVATPPGRRTPLQLPLFGVLTVCCSCFRLQLRGRWTNRVIRTSDYPNTNFSHGICPSCLKKLYPDIANRRAQARRTSGPSRPPKASDR